MEEEKQVPCENCEKLFPESKVDLHEAYCIRNFKKCEVCKEFIDKSEAENHFKEKHLKQKCKFCDLQLDPQLLQTHEQTNCIKRPRDCQYCEVQFPQNEIFQHEDKCGSKTKNCPSCDKYVVTKDYEMHLISCLDQGQQQQQNYSQQKQSNNNSNIGFINKNVTSNVRVKNNYNNNNGNSQPQKNQNNNGFYDNPQQMFEDDEEYVRQLQAQERFEMENKYNQGMNSNQNNNYNQQKQQSQYKQNNNNNQNNKWINSQVNPSQMGDTYNQSQDPELQKVLMESLMQQNYGDVQDIRDPKNSGNKPQIKQPSSQQIPQKMQPYDDDLQDEDPELLEAIAKSQQHK